MPLVNQHLQRFSHSLLVLVNDKNQSSDDILGHLESVELMIEIAYTTILNDVSREQFKSKIIDFLVEKQENKTDE